MSDENTLPQRGLGEFIDQAQSKVGMSDKDLAEALGFSRTSILTMVKSGGMKMPIGKVPLLATALEVPASDVLAAMLDDYFSGEVMQVMRKTWGMLDLTQNEKKLITSYRALTEGDNSEPRVLEGKNIIAVLMV
jgi:hypothetical protein